jgi:hypothetical protein
MPLDECRMTTPLLARVVPFRVASPDASSLEERWRGFPLASSRAPGCTLLRPMLTRDVDSHA